ncbi:MAG: cell division protein FtsZ, partial [Phyllobacteriaceae bacterium]|nr:cell division protein FtsZ [Phyllobacteriaceae bacterium]
SITGGPDLTLYEVDEAASRIREEVDSDANIILGATYDPNLNGTIRVSVVATGTDATMVQALEPAKPHASRTPLAVKRHVPVEASRPVVPPAPEMVFDEVEEIGNQVEAAVAQAFAAERPAQQHYAQEDDGILVEPYTPAAEMHFEPEEAPVVEEQPIPSVYVPSHAARPDGQRRMPRTEELPVVARRTQEMQERQDAEPRNARALFKRLASNVGLNLGAQQAEQRAEPRPAMADDNAARSAIEAGGARTSRVPAATEGARGNLDNQGRSQQAPVAKEQLEIPAFLRKHG